MAEINAVSGSTPLTREAFVDTLFDVVYAELPPSIGDEDAQRIAARQAAGLLRELAASGAWLEEFGGDMPTACSALADSIERGE